MKWLQIAENLPVGHKVRHDCPECGANSNTFAACINNNIKEYSIFCHACKFIETHSKGKQTLAELQKLKELNDAAEQYNDRSIKLPTDFDTDIPLVGRLWLYSGGISPSVWSEYKFGWSESLQRVVMPVYDDSGNLVWYQARAILNGQRPKYLQPSAKRDHIVFEARPTKQHTTTCVVVEDILSAIRVGKFIDTYSILGTRITNNHLNKLSKYDKVVTWMDSDRAGRKSAYSIRKGVSMLTDVGNILTRKDPKKLSDKEIKDELCLNG